MKNLFWCIAVLSGAIVLADMGCRGSGAKEGNQRDSFKVELAKAPDSSTLAMHKYANSITQLKIDSICLPDCTTPQCTDSMLSHHYIPDSAAKIDTQSDNVLALSVGIKQKFFNQFIDSGDCNDDLYILKDTLQEVFYFGLIANDSLFKDTKVCYEIALLRALRTLSPREYVIYHVKQTTSGKKSDLIIGIWLPDNTVRFYDLSHPPAE